MSLTEKLARCGEIRCLSTFRPAVMQLQSGVVREQGLIAFWNKVKQL